MLNPPGSGPTRPDKTAERMAQERQSPGATSAGGHGADAPDNDTAQTSASFQPAGPSTTSANTAARRGDSAAASAEASAQTAAAASIDAAQAPSSAAPDAVDDEMPLLSSPTREERIRGAAYRISQNRDPSDGDAVTDWLQAEAEVDAAITAPHLRGVDSSESAP